MHVNVTLDLGHGVTVHRLDEVAPIDETLGLAGTLVGEAAIAKLYPDLEVLARTDEVPTIIAIEGYPTSHGRVDEDGHVVWAVIGLPGIVGFFSDEWVDLMAKGHDCADHDSWPCTAVASARNADEAR